MKKLLSVIFAIFITFTCWCNDYEWTLVQGTDVFGDPIDEYSLGVLLHAPPDTRHLIPYMGVALHNKHDFVVLFGSDSAHVKYARYVDFKFKCTDKAGESKVITYRVDETISAGSVCFLYIDEPTQLLSALREGNRVVMRVETDDGYFALYQLPVKNFDLLVTELLN